MYSNKILFIFIVFLFSCSKTSVNPNDDGQIEIIILQLNDVYEIAPLPGDNLGGLARVATLRKTLMLENKNMITIHAGDFLNPSVIGTLSDPHGNRIRGAHMVEVMNATGIDLVTFGNHEFDLKEDDLQKRLDESEFGWVSSNVLHTQKGKAKPFYKQVGNKKQYIPENVIRTFTDKDGTQVKVGFFGVTLDVQQQPYLAYEDVTQRSIAMHAELKKKTDFIIPITHLNIEEDIKLAKRLPHFPLMVGGHDHDHMRRIIGATTIAKADANAKTVYVHTIKYDKKETAYTVYSELVAIDDSIKEDPVVKKIVDKWMNIAKEDLDKKGFDPNKLVTNLERDLDGRESTVRAGQCAIGKIVADAIFETAKTGADAAFVNSGSIRVDDILKGKLTQYDIIRMLPYKNSVWEVKMTGTLLKKILEAHLDSRGEGAYLQLSGIEADESSKTFKINGALLRTDKNYTIAMSNFMLAGYDYKFLTEKTEGILNIAQPDKDDENDLRNDIRKAVISFLQK